MTSTLDVPVVRAGRRHRHRRATFVTLVLTALVVCLFVLTMMVGSYYVSPVGVVKAVLGIGDDPTNDFIVRDLRLPTASAGLAVAVGLAIAVAVCDTHLTMPKASPVCV